MSVEGATQMSNAGRGNMEIPEEEIGAAFREMPEFVKKGLIRVSGGQMYLKAPYRVLWMRSEHKDWSIVTSIEFADYEKGFDTFYTGNDIYGIVSDLILIALIIASAIAGYSINRWLQDFAYRVDINWWVFVMAGIVEALIDFLTLSFQEIKAALANPINSLRSE